MKINFSKNLVIMRKEKNLTQEKLAEKVGVSRQAVAKWESGECIPELYKIVGLAEALDVSIDELVNGDLKGRNPDSEWSEEISEKLDTILTEIRKRNIKVMDYFLEEGVVPDLLDVNGEIPVEALSAEAGLEWEKGHYDTAIELLEEALTYGDVASGETLISWYQEILNFYAYYESDYVYYEKLLEYAQKLQKYGKIMEIYLKSKLV